MFPVRDGLRRVIRYSFPFTLGPFEILEDFIPIRRLEGGDYIGRPFPLPPQNPKTYILCFRQNSCNPWTILFTLHALRLCAIKNSTGNSVFPKTHSQSPALRGWLPAQYRGLIPQ